MKKKLSLLMVALVAVAAFAVQISRRAAEPEVYAVPADFKPTDLQEVQATASVKLTYGKDSEWQASKPNTLDVNLLNAVVGTNNPKDGDIDDTKASGKKSTGSGYTTGNKNLPQSGTYYIFKPSKNGTIKAGIKLNAIKSFYITDGEGNCLNAGITITDKDGVEKTLGTNKDGNDNDIEYSLPESLTGYVEFAVEKDGTYYMFCTGSKLSFYGFYFTEAADPDPEPAAEQITSTYVFTTAKWNATLNDVAADWTSNKDGVGFSNNGVQVTASGTGASATSPESYNNISKIVVTYNTNKNAGAGSFDIKIGDNEKTTKDWAYSTGDGRSANYTIEYDYATPQSGAVTLTASTTTNSIYVVSIAITHDKPVPPAVEKPTFSPAGGEFIEAQSVELACETEGAEIFYALNDATEYTKYTAAISVTETTTIKAYAQKGEDKSAEATATYTIVTPLTVAEVIAAIDGGTAGNCYVQGFVSKVDSYNETYKSITYWISADGTTEGQQFEVYSGKGLNGADFTSVDEVKVGAAVVVYGYAKKFNDTYEFDKNNKLVKYEAPALQGTVFDYAAAGAAGETLTKVNLNFQVNMGEGKEDRTDRNFRGYKDYTGTNLPAECQVAIGEEQKVDANGLIVGQDRYLAVYGLHTGDKVAIYYTGVPEGKQPTYCPGTSVDTKAKIGSTELVSTTSAINSGDVIEITKAGSKNYIIMSIFNGMRISKVVIQKAALYDVTIAEGIENGSIKVSAAKAAAGDEVVVTATPAWSYALEAIFVMNGETAVEVTDGKFIMPAGNVSVSATFAADPSFTVFDYVAAGVAGETLTKVNLNFQVNMGEGKEDRTDRNFRGYKDYTGTNLPAECQVAIGEEQKVDENGLIVGQDRYLAVYGLHTGDKVAIYYTGVPEGKQPTYCPGTSVDTKAKIGSTELVSTTSAINSGDVIEITKAGSKNYIIMSIFNGMRISKVVIQKAALYDVTIAEGIENGSVKVSAAKAAAGDEVTVTATPTEFFKLDAITVKDAEDADVTITDGKFTMPAKAVTVSASFVIDPSVVVFDYAAAGVAGETLTKVNLNFQVNMGEGKEDRTDRNFRGYKDYTGINLPAECQVAIGEEQKVDENGLIVGQDRYLAVYGLHTGDKVAIYYTGVPEGKQPTYCPGTSVDTKAKIGSTELVSTTSAINSGDVIEITKAGSKNYIIMSIFNGMRISKVVIQKAALYNVTKAESITNGDIKLSATTAAAGDEVTVTATPAEGFELEAITVTGVNSNVAVEVTDGKFTMPADDVTVNATFVQEDVYIVAGSEASIFGTTWDGTDANNKMAKGADGKYSKTYTVADAINNVQLKVVENATNWYGDALGNNVTFNLTGAGDFTVTIDPATKEVSVTGTIVQFQTEFEYKDIYAVGNGAESDPWLNGITWDPAAAANKMTKVSDGVFEITFKNVPAAKGRMVKFAIDGAWTHNFGGAFSAFGTVTDAVYNGDNITFDTTAASDITLRIDLTNFDFATKSGAKFTISASPATGINAVKADALKDAQIYNLQGVRVDKAQKGLYIVNGKKVVIK